VQEEGSRRKGRERDVEEGRREEEEGREKEGEGREGHTKKAFEASSMIKVINTPLACKE
jgi:hypothetical protein